MIHEDLTGKILQACFEVSKELGAGFLESVYEKSLLVALKQKDLQVAAQVPLLVRFRDIIVGEFCADILVEGKVLIELKAFSNLVNEHYAQILNYLKATDLEVGMLINFGSPKIEYRRFDNRSIQKINVRDLLSE